MRCHAPPGAPWTANWTASRRLALVAYGSTWPVAGALRCRTFRHYCAVAPLCRVLERTRRRRLALVPHGSADPAAGAVVEGRRDVGSGKLPVCTRRFRRRFQRLYKTHCRGHSLIRPHVRTGTMDDENRALPCRTFRRYCAAARLCRVLERTRRRRLAEPLDGPSCSAAGLWRSALLEPRVLPLALPELIPHAAP